ncbi:MAG TPA: hypothetical protein VGS22_28525 [Thermoanaerobaculia bacterium]|jgi:hypothetical protein|nr:hypothetical protein [Thermoanaerobaculia bacterium]
MPRALWILVTAALLLAAVPAPDPGPPAWVEVDPNAIQKADQPMQIDVGGIPQGQRVTFQILQDCNSDHRPDLRGQGECKSPLYAMDSSKAGSQNMVEDSLDFSALEKSGTSLPRNRALWLRASRPGSQQGVLTLFGLVDDPCTLWQTTLQIFRLGACSKSGVAQALRRHRGPLGFEEKTFEVRRLFPAEEAPPIPLPGTRGATGVAWLDAQTLLVTASEAGSKLLRVPLEGKPTVLWQDAGEDGLSAAAPMALPGGPAGDKIAFVRQRLSGQESAEGRPVAFLSLWTGGSLDPTQDVVLPFRIQQLLASSPDGRQILALSLGIRENLPSFLQIDLGERTVQNLGYSATFYQVAFRSPKAEVSVASFEDVSTDQGWDLVLADAKGRLIKDLQARKQDDILPAWQPDGKSLAYLAEVETKEKKP